METMRAILHEMGPTLLAVATVLGVYYAVGKGILWISSKKK